MTILPIQAFRRPDETPDEVFYRIPRLVMHIDAAAVAAVTQLYREYFPAHGVILDLMSSWVSHLPPDVAYKRVVGVGMNAEELRANPQLADWLVQNLNRLPHLPFPDGSFEGAAVCVSIQYLTRPVTVLREVGRVLKPGAPLVITLSNRCFPSKAIAAWQRLNDAGHSQLVADYLRQAGTWTVIEELDRSPGPATDPLLVVVGRSTGRA